MRLLGGGVEESIQKPVDHDVSSGQQYSTDVPRFDPWTEAHS